MKAKIKIECKNPEMIIKALKPDMDSRRFDVELEVDDGKVELKVEAKDIAGLLAGINSYIKLIRTAINTEEIK
jgi:tRNA threonylcarbamoyladenosine modification (KEOPS) complex  Pcc1 subunit